MRSSLRSAHSRDRRGEDRALWTPAREGKTPDVRLVSIGGCEEALPGVI